MTFSLFCPMCKPFAQRGGLLFILGFLIMGLPFDCQVYATEKNSRIVQLLDGAKFDEALEMASRLAKNGNPEGQYYLGMMYINGIATEKDIDDGIALLQKSAKQSNILALNELTQIYFSSNTFVKKNEQLAASFAKRSADLGDAIGQYNYAYSLAYGVGVAKDEKKAIDLFLKSANQGNASAQHSLGYMNFEGIGVHKSNSQAEKWYRLAAQNGMALSMRALGIMHAAGDIGFKRPELQLAWLRLAKRNGLDWVQADISELEKALSPEMLKAAETAERQCLNSNMRDCE
jgi:uncharacterized protein